MTCCAQTIIHPQDGISPRKQAVAKLKSQICELAGKVRKRRIYAKAELHGYEKHQLQMEAKNMGSQCVRPRLIAYGLLRYKPYEVIENKTRADLLSLATTVQIQLVETFKGIIPTEQIYDIFSVKWIWDWMKGEKEFSGIGPESQEKILRSA